MKQTSLLWSGSLLVFLPFLALAQNPAPDGNAPAPGTDVIQVVCDQQPVEQGLTFDRTGVRATSIVVGGKSYDAWIADQPTMPSMGWMRSFRFTVTDPHFQKGGRPAIDLEATCYVTKPGPIEIRADTSEGNKVVFSTWGSGKGWETYRVHLDNAFFGARPDTSAEHPSLEGFDLRMDTFTTPLYLRSLRLVGYDTEHDVVWSRMLKVNSLTSSLPGGVLVVQKGPAQKLNASLQNLAQVPTDIHYRAQITDYDDKVRYTTDEKVTLAPASSLPIALTFDTSDWPLGPYDGEVELYSEANPKEVLFKEAFRLGVISSTTLDKARPGEFLYGLDAASNFPTHTPTAFAYYRLMGVDILRNIYDEKVDETIDTIGKALGELSAEKMQGMLMCDPPKETDAAARDATLKQKEAFLEEVARRYGGAGVGRIRYFELGNEPDLPFFYPGPITDYAQSFSEMRAAIKAGAKKANLSDADTVVMNGGLSFAGQVATQRAEDFVKALDPADIDAIAYHGHGPDIHAERNAYERIYAVAKKYGKENHAFIETESGYSGLDHRSMEEQARTAVEKMVYAQSKGAPIFIFFRLYMEGAGESEGGYGMTDNFIEPRPSVMAYRNMVERLRHHVFSGTLDLAGEGGIHDVDGFLFEEKDAGGQLTGRKATVLFAEKPAQNDVRLRLDAAGATIMEATLCDMYGNLSPVPVLTGNVVSVPVGLNPVFLSWKSPGDTSRVEVVAPMLALADKEPLLANAENKVEVTLRDVQPQPLDANVSLVATTRLATETQPATIKVTIPPDQPATVAFTVKLGRAEQPLRLPLWWKAFTDVDLNKANLEQLQTIPDSLTGNRGTASGHFVWATNNHIDFAKIDGGCSEKRPALAFAYIDSPGDISFPCAASADWWMAWYVNGTKVYDTLAVGNRVSSLADHVFDLPLKKGRNLIAVEVLSGSGGWALDFGGPKERQVALTVGNDPDSVAIDLQADGKTLGQLKVPVQLQDVVPSIDANAALDQPASWMPLEPLTLLDESAVKNLWMKQPDSSRWYGGKKDLSAIVWLRDSGQSLQLFVAVTDDKLVEATSPGELAQADSLRVVVANDEGKALLDLTGGLIADKPALSAPMTGVAFAASRDLTSGQDPQTLYRFEIPKSIIGAQPFRLNLSVSDNDDNFLKQTLDLGDVKNPVAGVRLKTND